MRNINMLVTETEKDFIEKMRIIGDGALREVNVSGGESVDISSMETTTRLKCGYSEDIVLDNASSLADSGHDFSIGLIVALTLARSEHRRDNPSTTYVPPHLSSRNLHEQYEDKYRRRGELKLESIETFAHSQ